MNQDHACPPEFLALAHAMADAAAEVIRPHFRNRLAIDAKPDASPVTIADRDAEAVMRRMIEAHFPEHGIRGEEFGVCRTDAEWVWVLDPIDGTKSFISGSLAFGSQIALVRQGMPVLGIIDQPITKERWVGRRGSPTLFNGAAVRTSDTDRLNEAIVYTSALEQFDPHTRERFSELAAGARFTRMSHDCYAAGLLALGTVDLLVESKVFDYDILPQIPIIEGAGGIVSDWDGRPLDDASQYETVLMAANEALHATALERLRRQ
ncbi:inositol monophosphatase family protein [Rhizobium sp. ARZ01]|uniref:inositol monophosphatase family protein n=1 Tax=Rhizobium sp. ARZ01 TaxID=2769313 RepID=UPI0017820D31|nr:inositol monophosphatase family protein [Rhizobium sp. ARZ01]MBD9372739.1 inositol monophosphatase family protein [Rhizobium sp. ARZ01]